MPLQSSGAISLDNIATEFGGSQPHSLSEYYAGGGLVPGGTSGTNGAVPSSGAISMSQFYGASNVTHFLSSFDSASVYSNYRTLWSGGLIVDSSQNFFLGGDTPNFIAKINSQGVLQNHWQPTNLASTTADLAVDSSNNLYSLFHLEGGDQYTYLYKHNASAQFVYGRQLLIGAPGSGQHNVIKMTADAAGNLVITATRGPYAFIIKLDTSGNIVWSKYVTGAWNDFYGGHAQDASGNIYCSGYYSAAGPYIILKLNSSGVLQWSKNIENNPLNLRRTRVDSAGNVYLFHRNQYTASHGVMKFDTNGNLVFSRKLHKDSTDWNFSGFQGGAVDADGNSYSVMTYRAPTGWPDPQRGTMAKWNSSGTLQWQREVFIEAQDLEMRLAAIGPGSVYFTGRYYQGSSIRYLTLKVPPDGSKTGTRSLGGLPVTYQASSLDETDFAVTLSAGSATVSNASIDNVAEYGQPSTFSGSTIVLTI